MERDKERRISPVHLKMLRLRVKGLSYDKIGKQTGKAAPNVKTTLDYVRNAFPIIRQIVYAIEDEGLLEKKTDFREAIEKGIEEKIKDGFPGVSKLPYGFFHEDGKVAFDYTKEQNVKHIFEGRADGKSMRQLSRETGLSHHQVMDTLLSPFYIGKFPCRGVLLKAAWKPIIDSELWNRVQPKSRSHGKPPFGYKLIANRYEPDLEKAAKVKEIFQLRLEGHSIMAMSRKTGVPETTIKHMLRNRHYIGEISVAGHWVKGEHKTLIDQETFLKAQRLRRPKWKPLWEIQRQRKLETNKKVLAVLATSPEGLTRGEVAKKTDVPRTTLTVVFQRLRDDGIIERDKQLGKFGKWHVKKEFLDSLRPQEQ